MASRKANSLTVATIILLIVLLIVFRLRLGLSKPFYLILGADTAVILAIFIWVFLQYRADRQRKSFEQRLVSESRELRMEYSFLRKVAGVPTRFRYKDLEVATDNFQALIGRGGSASVFKGILDDGTHVAVKRLQAIERGEKEFRAEVTAIASVQHVNLVRLIGYSSLPGGPRFLIYEFIHNGSLNNWIFPRPGSLSCLPWDLRLRVAIDVAKGLAYLHHDCRSTILHLDVKPENILLDQNFRAVVSDFGFSKLMGRDVSRVYSRIRGTRGYIAPEWLLANGVTEKSDIYGYGMVLLEIIGGRRNVCSIGDGDSSVRKWSYFPKIVIDKLRLGKLMDVVDERLVNGGDRIDEGTLRVLVCVAMWCIQEDPKLRPSMARVVDMLQLRVVVDDPPETEMIILDLLSIDSESGSSHDGVGMETVVRTHQVGGQRPLTSTYSSFAMSVLSGR